MQDRELTFIDFPSQAVGITVLMRFVAPSGSRKIPKTGFLSRARIRRRPSTLFATPNRWVGQ